MSDGQWDVNKALAALSEQPWSGRAWRLHRPRYGATDPGGSLRVSGRYNQGNDLYSADEVWAALYLALAPETALAEIVRHVQPETVAQLNDYRLSELAVNLSGVLDCTDAADLGLPSLEVLLHDYDAELPRQLAGAAVKAGAEAILVPSATALGNNLIVFTANLRTSSQLEFVDSRDPRLFVRRE